ncbi:MAG: PDZ domain-containing protein [Chloroflexales bacterium]|nr:PDZ domain-containing protein [Chloroflexales bacterium]
MFAHRKDAERAGPGPLRTPRLGVRAARPRSAAGLRQTAILVGALGLTALALAACATSRSAPPARLVSTPIAVVAGLTAAPALPEPTAAALAPTSTTPRPAAVATPPPSPSVPPSPTPMGIEVRRQIFTEVWKTISEHYLYSDFGGVDWDAVRVEFEQRIDQAPTDERFYQLVSEMVARLGDDHSRFLPPQAAQRQDELSSGREEQVGIGVVALPLRDALLIQHVFPDSPAQRAGLRSRDRIVAIDGAFYASADIQGPEGSQVRLTVVRPGAESRDIVITRRRVEGRITPMARRLTGDIGYLSITTLWVSDMDRQVSAALADVAAPRPLRGLILDLRSNPGGWRSVLTGILGHFISGEVGSFTSRKEDTPLVIEPGARPDLRGLPLVVLIDGGTASYAELIAAVLQSRAGAVVVGAPSAGNTETIYSYELTGGARLWVAQEGFRLAEGADLEGVGVYPDIAVLDDWTRFSEAEDPGIQEALRLLSPSAGGK